MRFRELRAKNRVDSSTSLTLTNASVAGFAPEFAHQAFGQCTTMRKQSTCIKSFDLRHSYCDEKQKITKTRKRLTVIRTSSIIMQVRTNCSMEFKLQKFLRQPYNRQAALRPEKSQWRGKTMVLPRFLLQITKFIKLYEESNRRRQEMSGLY